MGPAPKLISVRMGVGAQSCATKQPGDAFCFTNVSQQPLIVLTFDRPLAATSEFRDNYAIVSGSSGNLAFKRVRIDPVERAAVLALADTTVSGPDARLAGNTEYRLILKSSDDPRNRLGSYEGARFEGAVVRFTTRAAAGDEETELDPAPVDACEATKILASNCAGATCHGASGVPPAMGLSLITHEAMVATAIGQRSALVQTAQHPPPGVGTPSGDFPYGMAIIENGSSARSFLLYKIMMDAERTATANDAGVYTVPAPPGIPGGEVSAKTDPLVAVANELRRRIPGSEMPPRFSIADGGPTGFRPLTLDQLRTIRRWIDANTPPCTTPPGDAGPDAMGDAMGDVMGDAVGDVRSDVGGG